MNIFLSVTCISLVIGLYFRVFKEYQMQKKILKGRELRRKQKLDIKTCINNKDNYIKPKEWTKQKNKGKHPCKMNKPITKRNYAENISYMLER